MLAALVQLAIPEVVVGQPELKKNRQRVSCCLDRVVVRQNHPCVVNRRALFQGPISGRESLKNGGASDLGTAGEK